MSTPMWPGVICPTGELTMSVIRVTDADRVRTITFTRPDQANAFDEALYLAVAGALAGAASDDGTGAVVLTGEGRTFCAGTDLVEMAAMVASLGTADGSPDAPRGEANGEPSGDEGSAGRGFVTLLDVLSAFPKPLLAAVNGAGVGLGLTMLAHCDLVLMADTARLKAPFAAMGVPPEAASSYLLPRRMGRQAAALALFTSRWITAAEAVECGLALRQVPADEVVAETVALAREIAALSLPSLLATKRLLLDAEAAGVARARRLEDAAFAELLRGQGVEQAVLGQLDH
jgi:enoyl-CoA hydratase/carnithine racemase